MNQRKIIVRVDPDIEDLVPGFLRHRRTDVNSIREALDNDNYETIMSLAHKIKGQGGSYGFDTISEIGEAIEVAAKSEDTEGVRQKVAEFASYLEQVEVIYE